MIKVLHFGDMHLDSPFSGVSVQEGERLREELRNLFCGIMKLAAEFDIVLIAGDLFDCGYVSPETLELVKKAIRECEKPVIIAPGNHDPYKAGSVWTSGTWPENALIFSDEHLAHYDLQPAGQPVTVWGWAFTSDRMDTCPLSEGLVPFKGRINILCCHGDMSSPITKYCPVTPTAVAVSGCDYVALGHIHKAPEPCVCGKTTAAYCGFPEGRSWDETGNGGILSVTLDEGRMPVVTKIITGHHRYETVSVDVTGCGSDEETISCIAPLVAEFENASVRIGLEGAVPPSYKPNTQKIADMTAHPSDVTLTVEDNTIPVYGAEYLEKDMTVRGEFYRSLLPGLSSEDREERAVASEALRIGLLSLEGRAF